MKRLFRYILTLSFVVFNTSQILLCQNFSSFFIDFLRYPERQSNNVAFPLRTENGVIKNTQAYQPIRFVTRANIPIICTDSLDAVSSQKEVNVAIIDMIKRKSVQYTFAKHGKTWRLSSAEKGTDYMGENDFVEFLFSYSQSIDFQKKRTIFPFPYRIYKENKSTEIESKLMMPHEWDTFDFVALFPSICLFTSANSAERNNRRLFVMKNGAPYLFFNFININKKWYLIEMEEYR